MAITIAIIVGLVVLMAVAAFLFVWVIRSFDKIAHRKITGKFSKSEANMAVISITGIIRYGSKKESSFRKIMAQIQRVKEMDSKYLAALIVRINTPGGAAGASHEIYEALLDLKERKGIKIVALMEDLAASGGVYAAMAADEIVATPGTMTGSVGVIIPHYDLSELFKIAKIKSENVKSGANKDMMSMSKPMAKESREIAQAMIDDCYEAFCEVISKSRNLPIDEVKKFADGRILSARQAKDCGLIDEIGGYNTAIAVARRLTDLPELSEDIEEIEAPKSIAEQLGFAGGLSALSEDISFKTEYSGIPLWLMKK